MNDKDFDFLASFDGVWKNYQKDNTCKELGNNPAHLTTMNQICIRQGLEPANLGCGNCIPKMFTRIMKRYDLIKAERAAVPEATKPEVIDGSQFENKKYKPKK